MAYTIVKQLIPQSKYNLKATYTMAPEYITVHNTANDASAANEIKYMSGNNNATSYHVAIDDKQAIEVIPFNRTAWHCGDGANGKGNRKSIGIEICYSKSGGQRYLDAEENAVQYIAHILHEKGWGVDRVKQHYDWSKKNCPHRIRGEGRWDSFVARVKTALDKLNSTTSAKVDVSKKIGVQAAEGANVYRLQSGRYNTHKEAQAALTNLLAVGAISYGTILEFDDGYRIESGAYRGNGNAQQASKDAKAVATNAVKNGHLGYVTIIGYKE